MATLSKRSVPVSVRMSPSLINEVRRASLNMEISDQDTIRQSLKLGLRILEMHDYDLIGAMADKSISSQKTDTKKMYKKILSEEE
jgi:hypothetical protein